MRILLFIKTLITASLLSPLSLAVADTLTVDGDLNVEGNVTVGTPTTGAGVIIHGESGSTAAPSLTVKGDGNVVFEEATGTNKNRFEWLPSHNMLISGENNDLVGEPYEHWTRLKLSSFICRIIVQSG